MGVFLLAYKLVQLVSSISHTQLNKSNKMKSYSSMNCFFFSCCILFQLSLVAVSADPPYKAVNLGGWLVAEGWMSPPELFNGIPNKYLLDGAKVQLMSAMLKKYIAAENGGGGDLVPNRTKVEGWEIFRLWRINESTFYLRVNNNQFVGLSNQGSGRRIVAVATNPSQQETLEIVFQNNAIDKKSPYRIRIKASNGFFLQAPRDSLLIANYQAETGWGDDDPSVFIMTANGNEIMRGEYQLTNGYGPRAQEVMTNHWNSYITENDFQFMSANGVTAVRIPVGWWIAVNPKPKPFISGSLKALSNAFMWAGKYNLKVIIDLHAVPGSQNGNDHSGSRDGSLEWGDSKIQETVEVIDFLASRFGKDPSLAAIELINEPHGPQITAATLNKYYRAGYEAVRKYTQSAYVILSNRLGEHEPTEFLQLGRSLPRSVIDVHYYSIFEEMLKKMTVQQNIEYIYSTRSTQLNNINQQTTPLTFVGEWSAALPGTVQPEDNGRFAKAQTEVYGSATFGWAYWSYKNIFDDWSLESMIKRNLIKL